MKLVICFLTLALAINTMAQAQSLPVVPPAGDQNRIYQNENVTTKKSITTDIIVLKKPAKLKFKKIEANGDGSVTVFEPKFYYHGAWRSIEAETDSINSVCKLLNPKYVNTDFDIQYAGSYELYVRLNLQINLSVNIYRVRGDDVRYTSLLELITCKELSKKQVSDLGAEQKMQWAHWAVPQQQK